MQKGGKREPDYGDAHVVGRAHDAAKSCLKAVRYFLIASDLRTGVAETHQYQEGVRADLEGRGPFQSLVAPLRDALDLADMEISPAFRLLPDDDARQIHPWSRNYFELAEFLARNLLDCIREVDPDLYPYVDEREIDQALATCTGEESYSRKDIRHILCSQRCRYASIHEYRASRFAEYVRTEWRFNGQQQDLPIDYDRLEADLFRKWQKLDEALRHDAEARAEAFELPQGLRNSAASRRRRTKTESKSNADSKQLIHESTANPPAKYRRDQKVDGDPIGPLVGTKQDLGYALHTREVKRRQQALHFDKLAREETIWARSSAGVPGKIEVFLTSFAKLHSANDRLESLLKRSDAQ